MKKLLSLLLVCLIACLSFSSCKKNIDVEPEVDEEIITTDDKSLKLVYSVSDSLNPFECKTEFNRYIMPLVYDGLYKLDSGYNPQPVIAVSSILSGCSLNVTLGENFFSDSSKITVSDIVYSFNLAKESKFYEEKLSNFLAVNVSTSNMIMFTLENPDPYAVSCLDFPIIKSGSDDMENHEFCIGSGRYQFKNYDDVVYLVINTNRTGFNPKVKTITLEAIHESDSVESSLEIGNTAFYFNDLSRYEYNRMNVQSKEVGLNNLVYIGVNNNSNIFSDANLRQAVYYALNREEIINTVYHSHARGAFTPFNPDWYALENNDFSFAYSKAKAEQLIETAETPVTYRSITLLYCEDNEVRSVLADMIKECLEDVGFSVELKPYSRDAYLYDVKACAFDLYIGEIKLESNMSLDPFFTGSVSYGVDEEGVAAMRYTSFKTGACELIDFVNTFISEVPFVPVCYRNGIACYTNSLECTFGACECDLFYDIDSWSLK